jgi:hypothetical protein
MVIKKRFLYETNDHYNDQYKKRFRPDKRVHQKWYKLNGLCH